MSLQWTQPVVSIGVLLINSEGKILVGKQKVNPAPKYSIFGGALEMGESFCHP